MREELAHIEKLITQAVMQIDPKESIDDDDPRYVDLSDLRGEEGHVINRMHLRFSRNISQGNRNLTFLITGHSGSGKSTELKTLKKRLEEEKYMVIYFSAEQALNIEDPGTPDILLAIAYEVYHQLQAKKISISERKLDNLLNWFSAVVYEKTNLKELEGEVKTTAKAEVGFPLIASLLAQITGRFRSVSDWKSTTRQEITKRISEFVAHTNELIDAAYEEAQNHGYKDLVLIIDNLEKLKLVEEKEKISNLEKIFLEDADILCALNCPTIYTVPLALICSTAGVRVSERYDDDFILPMVKLQHKDGKPNQEGIQRFIEVARKRIAPELRFQNSKALEEIALFSGGNIKEFIRLLSYLLNEAMPEDIPFSDELMQRTFRKLMRDYDLSVTAADYPLLAEVHRTKQQVATPEIHQQMIHRLFVLHYINGENWYDVHPAIQRLSGFQAAIASGRSINVS